MNEIILLIRETGLRRGRFHAWTQEHGLLVRSSRQPFLDGARALLKLGEDPATILTMVHESTGTRSLPRANWASGKIARHLIDQTFSKRARSSRKTLIRHRQCGGPPVGSRQARTGTIRFADVSKIARATRFVKSLVLSAARGATRRRERGC